MENEKKQLSRKLTNKTRRSYEVKNDTYPENAQKQALSDGVRDALGRKLRQSYQQTVDEEVPQRFQELLQKLKSGESKRGKDRGDV